MPKEVLAVDFDDCIVPFDIPFRSWLHEEHGVDLRAVKAVKGKFHYDEAYPKSGISKEQFGKFIDSYTEGFSSEAPPYPGAKEGLEQLSEVYELHIVTARPPQYRDVTEASVEQHIGVGVFEAVHTAEYNGDHKLTSKVSTFKKIGAVAAVDDADHNVNAAIGAGLKGFSIQLPEHSHNGHNLHESAIVIAGLGEILQYTDQVESARSA